MALRNGRFPLTQSALLLDAQGVCSSPLHHLFAAWGRTQVTVSTVPSALIHRGPAEEGQLVELML